MMTIPPLSLYIHLPWCVQKCPYCDFNSHKQPDELPETQYLNALTDDLKHYTTLLKTRPIHSIFIGGGTPSLFQASSIQNLLDTLAKHCTIPSNCEITMEANPGTFEQERFRAFRHAGINRLSLGVQSFQNDKLKHLGRIHSSNDAHQAITLAKDVGFNNFNIDLMYGLHQQTLDDALFDLEQAIALNPTHLSWYQLTIEPNTVFYRYPPKLPDDDYIWEMQHVGQALLARHSLNQYEISAYCLEDKQCQHNLNYWQFGDYLGLGAGAHSKLTDTTSQTVTRFSKMKVPKLYMANPTHEVNKHDVKSNDLVFELMLNALRLYRPIPLTLLESRTNIPREKISSELEQAADKNLIQIKNSNIVLTQQGKQFYNDLVNLFLDTSES